VYLFAANKSLYNFTVSASIKTPLCGFVVVVVVVVVLFCFVLLVISPAVFFFLLYLI
jgi:tetrahydromethanopterin S-methyltransferase subunit F